MATYQFSAESFAPVVGETFGELKSDGTNFTVYSMGLSAADNANESFQVVIPYVEGYSSTLTVDVDWWAESASTGDVVFDARVAALTPNTDSQDVTTDALAAASSVTDSHLGTTGARLHRAQITVSNVDSLANGDKLVVVVRRNTTAANADTMANDANVTSVTITTS